MPVRDEARLVGLLDGLQLARRRVRLRQGARPGVRVAGGLLQRRRHAAHRRRLVPPDVHDRLGGALRRPGRPTAAGSDLPARRGPTGRGARHRAVVRHLAAGLRRRPRYRGQAHRHRRPAHHRDRRHAGGLLLPHAGHEGVGPPGPGPGGPRVPGQRLAGAGGPDRARRGGGPGAGRPHGPGVRAGRAVRLSGGVGQDAGASRHAAARLRSGERPAGAPPPPGRRRPRAAHGVRQRHGADPDAHRRPDRRDGGASGARCGAGPPGPPGADRVVAPEPGGWRRRDRSRRGALRRPGGEPPAPGRPRIHPVHGLAGPRLRPRARRGHRSAGLPRADAQPAVRRPVGHGPWRTASGRRCGRSGTGPGRARRRRSDARRRALHRRRAHDPLRGAAARHRPRARPEGRAHDGAPGGRAGRRRAPARPVPPRRRRPRRGAPRRDRRGSHQPGPHPGRRVAGDGRRVRPPGP